jgi:hypothetical protein
VTYPDNCAFSGVNDRIALVQCRKITNLQILVKTKQLPVTSKTIDKEASTPHFIKTKGTAEVH